MLLPQAAQKRNLLLSLTRFCIFTGFVIAFLISMEKSANINTMNAKSDPGEKSTQILPLYICMKIFTTTLNPFSPNPLAYLAARTVGCVLMASMTLHVHAGMIFVACFANAFNCPMGSSTVTTQPQIKSQ